MLHFWPKLDDYYCSFLLDKLTYILGVGQDVVGCLRVILTFDEPLAIALTVSRQMVGLATLETAVSHNHTMCE